MEELITTDKGCYFIVNGELKETRTMISRAKVGSNIIINHRKFIIESPNEFNLCDRCFFYKNHMCQHTDLPCGASDRLSLDNVIYKLDETVVLNPDKIRTRDLNFIKNYRWSKHTK